jgi:capsid protein
VATDTFDLTDTFDELRSDFRASKSSAYTPRLRNVAASGSGADYHYAVEHQYLHMIERARHFERNDPVVGQGLRRLVSNVIQGGLTPDPKTGDDEINRILKDDWLEWSTDPDMCHSEGEFSFHQIERLTLRSTVRCGDIWHLLRDDGTIQPVEAHRPRSPRRTTRDVVNGVLLDENKRRQQVWISKEELSGYASIRRVSDIQKYDIRDSLGHRVVLQVYFPDRFSQRRGVTAFAPVADIVGMHDDLQFATLVKAKLASLLVLLREQTAGDTPGGDGPALAAGNIQTTNGAPFEPVPASVKQIPGIQAGLDVTAAFGQKITGFAPNIPNPEFFPHSMLLLTFIAVNLDLPLQVLLLDPQKSNFSSWRGAIDQARIRYREIQRDLINQLHRPVWRWRVRTLASKSSALRKMIGNNPNWLKHEWQRPSFAYIEPEKDAKADDVQQSRFLNSFRRLHGNRGQEFDEVADEMIGDRTLLVKLAHEAQAQLREEYPESDVTWRDILSAGLGGKVDVSSKAVSKPSKHEDGVDGE